MSSDDIDAHAQEILDNLGPKRRVRPRKAPALADAEMIEVDSPSGPIASWRLGVGPAFLRVHGFNDDNCLWAPLIDKAQAYGRAVVALDLPGHGFTKAARLSIPDAAQAVLAVGRALGPISAVIGHSFGCAAASLALDLGLAAKAAVLIAGGIPKPASHYIQALSARGVPQPVLDRAIVLQAAQAAEQGRDLSAFDLAPVWARRRERALILHADDDEQVPVDDARQIAASWPGAQLSLHQDLGHRGIAQDDQILDEVIDFLEGGP
jgi:pimeloyl-ACP methyl ester carboxylesterase